MLEHYAMIALLFVKYIYKNRLSGKILYWEY